MKNKVRKSLAGITLLLALSALNLASAESLTVALYPYVPRLQQFVDTIEAQWKAVEPSVPINWVPVSQWDGGYNINPSSNFDVYVFDAINIDYFKKNNWLVGLNKDQVDNFSDFISYAASGVTDPVSGLVYGIPQLGCGSILFYKNTDSALANAKTLKDVTTALGSCSYYSETPPNAGTGIMMDLAGGTTNATTYIESEHERLNTYPVPLPQNPGQVNQTSIGFVKQILASASFINAYYSGDNAYQRAAWFNQGYGRAYIGFTESMSQMSDANLQTIAFKPMPWSDNAQGNDSPLFYSDVIGIHPATSGRGTQANAIKLANLMASTKTMVDSVGPYQSSGPQYLMPVRHSIFDTLSKTYPVYKQMYTMVSSASPILFTLGDNSKPWLSAMKSTIVNDIKANPKCYTDINAGPINSNVQAQTVCPTTCKDYNGWSGQWTTTIPGQMSVCGCNTPRTQKNVAAR